MVSQEYGIAFSETLEILRHTKKESVDKIPNKFLMFLKKNESNNYISRLDFNKPLSEMNLSDKTIGILSLINEKYWCDEEKRKRFDDKLKQNEIEYQKELKEKYDASKLFENKQIKYIQNSELPELSKDKKQKWYINLFTKFLNIIKK